MPLYARAKPKERQNGATHPLAAGADARPFPVPPFDMAIGAALLMVAGLQACGDYTTDYPELAPTEQLLRDPVLPGHASGAARSGDTVKGELEARRGSLQSAGAGRAPLPIPAIWRSAPRICAPAPMRYATAIPQPILLQIP
ncbi:hypothetical protein [Paracoccus cavernae]|uniref:hypothetical protein n=1 Tax=Paracoccus cavernae TaxID=1571207 RepID=UPI0036394056